MCSILISQVFVNFDGVIFARLFSMTLPFFFETNGVLYLSQITYQKYVDIFMQRSHRCFPHCNVFYFLSVRLNFYNYRLSFF